MEFDMEPIEVEPSPIEVELMEEISLINCEILKVEHLNLDSGKGVTDFEEIPSTTPPLEEENRLTKKRRISSSCSDQENKSYKTNLNNAVAKKIPTPTECLAHRRRIAEYHDIVRKFGEKAVSHYNFLEPRVKPLVLNVVASAGLNVDLDLKKVLMTCPNVEYNPKRFAPCVMRIKNPKSTCLIFGSGRLIVSGCKSEQECYTAVRRYAYILKKFVQPEIGFVENYEIQNMSASCTLPFAVSLATMATRCDPSKRFSSYEPEIFPGLVLRLTDPKARIVVFCGGAILFTGLKSESELQRALEIVFPVCRSCRRY